MRPQRQVEIFVPLLQEGVDVWRPVKALHEGGDIYTIDKSNTILQDEWWKFQPGDSVRCRPHTFTDGKVALVPVERVKPSASRGEVGDLNQMVNEWDPLGLIEDGAPEDEYDCLVQKIYSLLQKESSPKAIEELILDELESHFGMGESNVSLHRREAYLKDVTNFSERAATWFKGRRGAAS